MNNSARDALRAKVADSVWHRSECFERFDTTKAAFICSCDNNARVDAIMDAFDEYIRAVVNNGMLVLGMEPSEWVDDWIAGGSDGE